MSIGTRECWQKVNGEQRAAVYRDERVAHWTVQKPLYDRELLSISQISNFGILLLYVCVQTSQKNRQKTRQANNLLAKHTMFRERRNSICYTALNSDGIKPLSRAYGILFHPYNRPNKLDEAH